MSTTPPQTPPPEEAPASHPEAPAEAPPAPDAALQQPSADAEPATPEPAASEPAATEPVTASAPSAPEDQPAVAAAADPPSDAAPASAEASSTATLSQSPKLESKRPPPLPSPGPQISQPQQPVSTAAPAPVKAGPPAIIEHVRANFGDVLGPPMEAEVYRRGWVEATVEELHEQLRQNAQAIFLALSTRLATEDLTEAVFNMLGGILRFHHGDQTQNLLTMLHRAYPIDHLFAAMLNPVYLKNLVEALLTSRQNPNQRQGGQQRGAGASQAAGAQPQGESGSHRGPQASGGAQFNRNGPNPVASPSGATPVHGNGGSFPGTDSPGPQGAPRSQKGSSSSPRNATSPTAPNPPVPRSQQIRQQQQQQQMMQPQQPVVNRGNGNGETDMNQQFHALSQAQAALQRTISGQPAGAQTGGRPAALEHEQVGTQSGGAFPTQGDGHHGMGNSNSGSSMFSGQPAQAQPPTPSSTTSSVPFSPLAAAFSAARNPKPAEAPGGKAPAGVLGGKGAMGRGGGGQPQAAAGRGGGQQPSNLAEGLQSMLGSGARGGRIRVENGGGMSWADTEESTASSTAAPDLELIGFLRQSNLAQLIEPLGPKTTLAQLRQMGPQEFDATLKRWIASTRHRNDLKRALHGDGRMPVERQAWLRQQQQQQQQNPSGTPPQGPAAQSALAPAGAPGGLPAPRSKNAPAVGPAAAAAAPPPGGYLPGQTFGVGNAQVMFLRLKLCPHEPDTPQPTDSSFARDAQKQIGVPRAKYLTTTWALGGRGHGSDPVPTVTFTIPKQAAETLRQLEQTTLSIANVLYTVEKCTMGPNLPRNVRLPDNHALHNMANSTMTSAPELGGKVDHHTPAVASAGPSSYSAVSAGRVPPNKAAPAPKSPKARPAGPGTASTTPQQKPPRHADPAAKPTPEHGPARATHAPAPVHGKGPMHSGKRPHDDDERAQLCRFYGGNPGCRRGADCQFRHVTPSNAPAPQVAAPAAHHASPGRGRGRGPAPKTDEADHASQPRGRGRAAGPRADDDATPGRSSHRRSRGGH